MLSLIFSQPLRLVRRHRRAFFHPQARMVATTHTAPKDVLVVGFGAVGMIYAYILQRSGIARVSAVARSNYEAIERDGIRILSDKYGNIKSWRPDCLYSSVHEAAQAGHPYSHVLVSTKVLPELKATSAILEPLLSPSYPHPQPVYVLLQNGLGIEDELYKAASKLPSADPPRILSCSVYIGTNLLDYNTVQHNDFDRLVMGLFKPGNYTDESQTEAEIATLNGIAGMIIKGGGEVTVVPEIQRHRFKKNFWNIAFSSIATTSRYSLRAIFQEPDVEEVLVPVIRKLMLENLAVGRAMGFNEAALPSSVVDDTIQLTSDIHRRPDSKHKPSMLLDCENGRPMEIEVIVGEVLRKAQELGIDTPRIEMLYALLVIMQRQITKMKQ